MLGHALDMRQGPGLAAAGPLEGGLVSFSAWLDSSLAAGHHGDALSTNGMQLWPPLVPRERGICHICKKCSSL